MASFTLADASKQVKEFIDTSDLKRVAAKEYLHNLSSEKLRALLMEVLVTNGIEFCDQLKEGWLCMDMLVEEVVQMVEDVGERVIVVDRWDSTPRPPAGGCAKDEDNTVRWTKKTVDALRHRRADGMAQPWLYKGTQYLRNSHNEVWLKGKDGSLGEWQGIYLPTEDRFHSLAEPMFDDKA